MEESGVSLSATSEAALIIRVTIASARHSHQSSVDVQLRLQAAGVVAIDC
jgi:hypothetical protein